MEQKRIFLDQSLSQEVQKYLKRKNPEYQTDDKRMVFSSEELSKIEILKFDTQKTSISYLKYFPSLKHLRVKEEINVLKINQKTSKVQEKNTFFDKHIEEIAKYCPNLEEITLGNNSSIEHLNKFKHMKDICIDGMIDFNEESFKMIAELAPETESLEIKQCDDFEICDFSIAVFRNLKSLNLISNTNLERISGIDKLKSIEQLDISGNSNLNKTSMYNVTHYAIKRANDLTKVGKALGLSDFVLDVRMFPYALGNNNIENIKSHITWSERYSDVAIKNKFFSVKKPIKYTTRQMEQINKISNNIISKLIRQTDTLDEKFAILYQYLKSNIEYNQDGLEKNEKVQYGKSHTNGILQGFIEGRVVCEGYSRMLQYLLDKCDISSELVVCTHCQTQEQRNNLLKNKFTMEENHSMLITNLPCGRFISDLTFDAGEFQSHFRLGSPVSYKTQYALLTLEQMDLAHQGDGFDERLKHESQNYGAIFNGYYQTDKQQLSQSYIDTLMEKAQKRIRERNPENIDFIPHRKSGKSTKKISNDMEKESLINMTALVKNALTHGVTMEDISKVEGLERTKDKSEVSRDD